MDLIRQSLWRIKCPQGNVRLRFCFPGNLPRQRLWRINPFDSKIKKKRCPFHTPHQANKSKLSTWVRFCFPERPAVGASSQGRVQLRVCRRRCPGRRRRLPVCAGRPRPVAPDAARNEQQLEGAKSTPLATVTSSGSGTSTKTSSGCRSRQSRERSRKRKSETRCRSSGRTAG
eukprot:GHVT01062486.1.p2 GENE.GHVT01062486.1~~GHVT01062486.1.p2  ORF type:complete len:173 (+),score=20.76 GHVT01062486.1:991-1509(+)